VVFLNHGKEVITRNRVSKRTLCRAIKSSRVRRRDNEFKWKTISLLEWGKLSKAQMKKERASTHEFRDGGGTCKGKLMSRGERRLLCRVVYIVGIETTTKKQNNTHISLDYPAQKSC